MASCEERVGVLADYRCLGEHGKLHSIGQPAEVGNFTVAAGLLIAEVVGRKSNNDQPTTLKPGIELFESIVLRGETTVTGGVHYQYHLALPLAK